MTDIVAVHHYDEKPDSAWALAYPTSAIDLARKPSPAREPQVKSRSRTKAPQDGMNANDPKDPKEHNDLGDPKDPLDPEDPKDPKKTKDTTKKAGPELEDRSVMQRLWKRKDPAGDQVSHGNQQKGKGEPMKPIMEKDRAPTDGLAKVAAEGELPPQEGPAIFFSEKEPSSKIVSLTDEHRPTKDSSLLGITTEGELGPHDQSAKAGSTTGSLPNDRPEKGTQDRDALKTESPEHRAREKPRPVSWLNHEDMLPKALPDARVLQFGYPIMSGQSDPNKRMKNLDLAADQLSSRLMEWRKDCPNRPILFIGHDFGLVVIERALIRLADTVAEKKDADAAREKNDADTVGEEKQADTVREKNPEQSILESTAGIIFLATPLKGSENSDYFTTRGDWFRPKSNISTASLHNTTSHLKKFKAAIEKRNIFLFRLNSTGKFSAPDDSNYLRVLGLIRRFVNSHRILTAAANEADDEVSDLIEQGVDSGVRNRSGQTALHIAIQKGHIRMARLLLGKGGADINLQDIDGQTAIHLAAEKGSSEAVDFLLRKGADVTVENKKGFLAIDLAKQRQGTNMQKVRSLLENPHLLDGPSGLTDRNWTEPIPPTDPKGHRACKHFRATLTEFFFISGEEKRNTQHPNIWEVLYGQGPESILDDGRPRDVGQATCRWFHIPANNVSEISCPGRREI